ncbi:hypothetical protein ACOMHN_029915 [Nucella lapillus]
MASNATHHPHPPTGIIQTPGWDGVTPFGLHFHSTVRVDVPADHLTLLTYLHVNYREYISSFCGGFLEIYLEGNRKTPMVCPQHFHQLQVLNSIFYVEFATRKTIVKNGDTGFQILFTFHAKACHPHQFADGLWNCSVPFWADFKEHLPCNLQQNCAGGEDEEECPYTTPDCGEGKVEVGGKCYLYIIPSYPIVPEEAMRMCHRKGFYLSPVRTKEDFLAWVPHWTLRRAYQPKTLEYPNLKVLTGVKVAPAGLPKMYEDILQWIDNTVVYSLPSTSIIKSEECTFLCSIPSGEKATFAFRTYDCTEQTMSEIMCSMEVLSTYTSARRPSLAMLFSPPIPHNHLTTCPGKHVTHDFLACDVKSNCFDSGFRFDEICRAPMTPLPPLFTCTNEMEQVSYTLVCDFRPNCQDSSDEDFCVFPKCTSKEFDCGNKQCVDVGKTCDKHHDCTNGMDEVICTNRWATEKPESPPPPAVITFDGEGSFSVQSPWARTTEIHRGSFRVTSGYKLTRRMKLSAAVTNVQDITGVSVLMCVFTLTICVMGSLSVPFMMTNLCVL